MRVMAKVILLVLLLVGLPMLGIVIAGQPLDRYLEFPPRTRYVQHAPFSWTVFAALALCIVASIVPFVVRLVTSCLTPGASRNSSSDPLRHQLIEKGSKFQERRLTSHGFPWWGWIGAALIALSWVLAWNRFTWFEPLQPFTFTPLWLGYILVINGWTFSRTGRCMMRRPAWRILLVVSS